MSTSASVWAAEWLAVMGQHSPESPRALRVRAAQATAHKYVRSAGLVPALDHEQVEAARAALANDRLLATARTGPAMSEDEWAAVEARFEARLPSLEASANRAAARNRDELRRRANASRAERRQRHGAAHTLRALADACETVEPVVSSHVLRIVSGQHWDLPWSMWERLPRAVAELLREWQQFATAHVGTAAARRWDALLSRALRLPRLRFTPWPLWHVALDTRTPAPRLRLLDVAHSATPIHGPTALCAA